MLSLARQKVKDTAEFLLEINFPEAALLTHPVSTGAGVGSSAVATVIGSSLAPLGACPLVSMATPALSKHEGASFYEIIKPNFAA